MVKLKEITKNNNSVTCLAFFEGCKEGVKLTYDVKTQNFRAFSFPKSFDYCTTHVAMARRYIEKVLKDKSDFPKERLIMWY